ncbi:hypothetical protein AZH51_04050 [Branchiibius sp. NY16-3462-2]|nr:hypothetical protein AZH51_04050 [Branchiibius sp. NY16-3462-2]
MCAGRDLTCSGVKRSGSNRDGCGQISGSRWIAAANTMHWSWVVIGHCPASIVSSRAPRTKPGAVGHNRSDSSRTRRM